MNKLSWFSILAITVILVIASCGKEKKQREFAQNTIVYDTSLPSNEAMAKYLAECNSNYFQNPKNRFASTTRATNFEKSTPPKESKKYVEWKKAIADEWLFAGNTEKSIAAYDEAIKKAEEEKERQLNEIDEDEA